MGDIISAVFGISYFVLGYWSVGQTVYANKVIIGRIGDMWIQRFLIGALFGWILIPVALLKKLLFHQSFFECTFGEKVGDLDKV